MLGLTVNDAGHPGRGIGTDALPYLDNIATGKSSLLKNVTSGYHYHTVTADSEETLDLIEKSLQENGFLAPLQEYEPSGVN
jgi:hypothetical protein